MKYKSLTFVKKTGLGQKSNLLPLLLSRASNSIRIQLFFSNICEVEHLGYTNSSNITKSNRLYKLSTIRKHNDGATSNEGVQLLENPTAQTNIKQLSPT